MEALECIKTRRSVRKYAEQPVSKEVLQQVVEAARYAPTWKNTQTVRYVAVMDQDLKKKIADDCVMDFAFNQKTISRAPVLVAVTSVDGISGYEKDGTFSTSKGTHWESFDAGIAAQTFCLAAHALGLGTVILGVFDADKVKEALQLPEDQSVAALIAVGYPVDQQGKSAPPRKETDELLSFRG